MHRAAEFRAAAETIGAVRGVLRAQPGWDAAALKTLAAAIVERTGVRRRAGRGRTAGAGGGGAIGRCDVRCGRVDEAARRPSSAGAAAAGPSWRRAVSTADARAVLDVARENAADVETEVSETVRHGQSASSRIVRTDQDTIALPCSSRFFAFLFKYERLVFEQGRFVLRGHPLDVAGGGGRRRRGAVRALDVPAASRRSRGRDRVVLLGDAHRALRWSCCSRCCGRCCCSRSRCRSRTSSASCSTTRAACRSPISNGKPRSDFVDRSVRPARRAAADRARQALRSRASSGSRRRPSGCSRRAT